MLKLTIFTKKDRTFISLHRNGELLYSSGYVEEVVRMLTELGVDKPRPLVDAAIDFGEVDIHEGSQRSE